MLNAVKHLLFTPYKQILRFAAIRQAVRTLGLRRERLCITAQNMAEFWSVATRPASARGVCGLSIAQAESRARLLERAFILLPEMPHSSNRFIGRPPRLPFEKRLRGLTGGPD
jgi:hypothetical protein